MDEQGTEDAIVDHEFELADHNARLDELEDRLSTAHPTPATPVGAKQRFRFAVPSPLSVVTLGARGSASSNGVATGAGGFALRTVENFAAQILMDTIIDTVGATTLHSDGPARLLSLEDLGLSGNAGVRVGTQDGDIEVTAGRVGHPDPSFTVVPSMDIPEPAVVDTAGPRSATESSRGVWDGVWMGLKAANTGTGLYRWFMGWYSPPAGYSPASIEPHAAGVIRRTLAVVGRFRGLVIPAVEAAVSAAEAAQGAQESSEPKVHIHGAGGVEVSSPNKVRLFGVGGAKLHSPKGSTLAGGLSASVKSPIAAKVYGGMMATLKSEAVAKISAPYAVMSGDYVELKGKEAAALSSANHTTVTSGLNVALDAPFVAIGGGSNVDISAGDRTRVTSRLAVELSAGERIRSTVEQSQVTLEREGVSIAHQSTKIDLSQRDGIRLDPGGGHYVLIDRNGVRFSITGVRLQRGEVTLRGRINLS